jgi:pimeloyl-ACP methyl ester carboxylesterase
MRRMKAKVVVGMVAVLAAVSADASDAGTEEIDLGGAPLFLRVPDKPAAGKPWVWIAEFFGHQKTVEDALLAKGWHVAYVRAADQLGSPWAMEMWEKAYEELTEQRGLAPKPAIWAISRGGLYALGWLRRHPDRASVLVLDNAVSDIRSWPAGKPLVRQGTGNPEEWERYKTIGGFPDDEAALAAAPRPADGMEAAVKSGVALISGYGTEDDIVPHEDNGQVLVDFWRAHAGEAHVFPNEGGGHFPHGIAEPRAVIELLTGDESAR